MLTLVFLIASQAFQPQGAIPSQYTCDGQDTSPPLEWHGVPNGSKTLALVVDDPDATDPDNPKMNTYVHWILYNIPATTNNLQAGVKAKDLPLGTQQGNNDWGRIGYGGPCPPSGQHHYHFKLYALDTVLPDLQHPTKLQLEKAMKGHIVGTTELIGVYQRK